MPMSAAQTEAAMDAQSASTVADTQNVHIDLKFVGVAFNPGAFYDMLNATYGTVASDKDAFSTTARSYQFTISA